MSCVSSMLSQDTSICPLFGVSKKLMPGKDFITPLSVDGVAVLLVVNPRLAWGEVISDTSSVEDGWVLTSSIGWEESGFNLLCILLFLAFLLLVECEDLPEYSELATEYVSGVIKFPRLAGGSGEVLGNLGFCCFGCLGLGRDFDVGGVLALGTSEVLLLGVASPCKLSSSIPPPSFELGFLVRFCHYLFVW